MRQKGTMIHSWIISKNSDRLYRRLFCSFLLLFCLVPCFAPPFLSASEALPDGAQSLLNGKRSLESSNYQKAIALLTAACEKLPVLGDYALQWRARAYEEEGNIDRSLADLRTLKERYKESPLIMKARLKEIELLEKKGDPSVGRLLEDMTKDNPSNMDIKYAYARWLKDNNDPQRARELLREVFISACPLSARASNELPPFYITADDLLKKGKTLNAAWRFEEAEKVLREALAHNTGHFTNEITDALAYSLFRQKRYKDAADLYKETKNIFWRARSIFRAGNDAAFQSELPEYSNSADTRVATVLIAYGEMTRRQGDIKGAFKIFDTVLSSYPSAKEEVLWASGWTYYLSGDYRNASGIFSKLAATFGDPKYLYWSRKCRVMLGYKDPSKPAGDRENSHDFYAYLTCLKNQQVLSPVSSKHLKTSLNPLASERVGILVKLGLKDEAAAELLSLSRKNPTPSDLVSISSYLKELGRFKNAIALVSKVPYSEDLHDLYYPRAFWPEVEEASRATSLDPYLILSVMREESRFEPEARSIAGAIGLMQLMPATAGQCNKNSKGRLKNGGVPSPVRLADPRTNILLGSSYLKQLLRKFNSVPIAIASYNAGEDAVSDWLKKGKYRTIDEFIEDIPYDETRNYVKKVMTAYFEYLRSNRDGDLSIAHVKIGDL
ncbi:MAG: transglycosylase SLT domain-containing protein [Nitrospirae bacterium]|nr:transglycosylase SLT domain-containing protein [Nitrospirota bacterium]